MALDQNKVDIITKVVVGSRLHELHTETSDWDYRGVHISPLRNVLSPFRKQKTLLGLKVMKTIQATS